MNKEILISATDLKKYFPVHKFMGGKQYVKAVDGVSLEINKGETFGLVGESGCGKSTLERTLIRMYDITDGKVTYKGKDITNEKAKNLQWMKDEVQIIFQDPYSALNPFWNVREIINEPLKKAGMEEKEAEERIEYLLNKVGMSKAEHFQLIRNSSYVMSRSQHLMYRSRHRLSICWKICRTNSV